MSDGYDVTLGELKKPFLCGDQGRRVPNPNAQCLLHPDDEHTNSDCPNQRFSLPALDLIDLYSPINADHDHHPASLMHDDHSVDLNLPLRIAQGHQPALLMHAQHPMKVPSHHHQKAEITVASEALKEKENLIPEQESVYDGQASLKKARILSPNTLRELILLVLFYFFFASLSILFCLCKDNGHQELGKPTAYANEDSDEPRRKVRAPRKYGRKRKSEHQTGRPLKILKTDLSESQVIDTLLQEMLENFTAVKELELALASEPNNLEKLEGKDNATLGFHKNKIQLARYRDEGTIPMHARDRANYLLNACINN